MERVTGVEPVSHPWQGRIIAAIRYPRKFRYRFPIKVTNWNTFFNQSMKYFGGLAGNWTQLRGFADRCLTSRPPGQHISKRLAIRSSEGAKDGADGQNWTDDTGIFSPLLYHWATSAYLVLPLLRIPAWPCQCGSRRHRLASINLNKEILAQKCLLNQ